MSLDNPPQRPAVFVAIPETPLDSAEAEISDKDRATLGPLLDLKIKTPSGDLVPVSTFTRIETSTAPRTPAT